MCGIVGVVHQDRQQPVSEAWLRGLTDTMTHRGPDDSGLFIDRHVGLGHRRLSIIDLGHGHQPIFNEDGSVCVVFNGEIYNYKPLQEELRRKGHTFKTQTDTEVIVHAYEEYGPDCVKRFHGMFAFALWDTRAQRLVLARDRVGKKPLYLYQDARGFLFASEIAALLKSGWITPEVNRDAIDFYMTLGYVPGPETLFKGITKLPPGSYLVAERGKSEVREYWQLENVQPASMSFEDAQAALKERLLESVKIRLVSDVPLGVFLSGGVDSSAVVACMSQLGVAPIKTFSVGFDNADEVSELPMAQLVADKFKTEHHEFRLEPLEFLESLDLLLAHTEEPIVEASGVPLYQLSKMAKQHVTVLLSGEGSDELFAGYDIYTKMRRLDRMRSLLRAAPLGLVKEMGARARVPEKVQKYLDWLAASSGERYHSVPCDLTPTLKRRLYTDEFRQSTDHRVERYFTDLRRKVGTDKSILSQMLYLDTKTWLTDDLLLKADKMTMAASVETRCPFLDHELIEFAASLPDHYKRTGEHGKLILKRVMADMLPQEILTGPKKGFPMPLKQWFRGALHGPVREILLSERSLSRGYVKPDYLTSILSSHRAGREDLSRRILSLLILELWHRKYIDR